MLDRSRTVLIAAALCMMSSVGLAFDETRYPNLSGQWQRVGEPLWAGSEAANRAAPLTPEYRAMYEANLAALKEGGHSGIDPTRICLPPGMPRIMNLYEPMEIVLTPDTVHFLIEHIHDSRRIHTDGRAWTSDIDDGFRGTTHGQWLDEDGDGRFDVLVAETRHFLGPRTFDATGLPLHNDNNTVVRERIYLDKADPNLLHDEITVTDSALTQPWTVKKSYRRGENLPNVARESVCADNNNLVTIGNEEYTVGTDGILVPTRRGQPGPDLRYFR
jgi:hypothetical protein